VTFQRSTASMVSTAEVPSLTAAPPPGPAPAQSDQSDNLQIAQSLRDMAALLDTQGDNPYRVAAYRRAADTLERLPRPVRELHAQQGEAGLVALPTIGTHIAAAVAEWLATGHWQQLDRLRGEADPDALRHGTSATDSRTGPPVALLLEVDRTYRAGAQAGTLPRIAPRRFNPSGTAWLPVMHIEHHGWHVTALYSNTARAHALGHVQDWVVLYAEDDDHQEHHYTVVTASRGPLAGRRVVRGREAECRALYAAAPGSGPGCC
jgi:DNA polymerase (family 10)